MSKPFYKGYVISNNKIPTVKITDPSNHLPLERIKEINPDEYVGVLSNEAVLIDFDDHESSEIVIEIVRDLGVRCRAIKTTRGLHLMFLADDHFNKNAVGCQLACGLFADIKLGKRNGIQVLKDKGEDREVIYDTKEYDPAPFFLRPLQVNKKTAIDFLGMGSGDGRNDALYTHMVRTITIMNKEESKRTAQIINDYIFKESLDSKEMDKVLRDEAFSGLKKGEPFFDDKQFLFDNFARYLIAEKDIVKINGLLHIYNNGIYEQGEEQIEREMIKTISRLNQTKRREAFAYINLLIEENKEPSLFNNLIVFRNTVYDIVTKKTREFSKEYVITNRIDWEYNPNAYSKTVDTMLDKVSCGDKEIRSILEEMIGYCFFRQNEMGKAFILTGPKSNGKSTVQSMIQKLLGRDNVASIDLKDLGARFMSAELYGKLANIGDDISDNYIDDSNIFKTIVTGGRLIAEKKGQNPFEFDPFAKCIFSSNNIPRTRDKTGAIKRRLIIIPFDRVFLPTDEDYDPYLKYKIINGTDEYDVDTNMSYLINLGIAGLHRVLENNEFTESVKVNQKIEEYDRENNPVKFWFDELGDPYEFLDGINSKYAYDMYCTFCNTNNLKNMSKIEFSKTIRHEFGLITKPAWLEGKSVRIFTKESGAND